MWLIEEAQSSLRGAWLLFLNLPDGLDHFNVSVQGFWRSFAAILVAAPFFVIGVMEQPRFFAQLTGDPIVPSINWAAMMLALVLSWVFFPLVVGSVARSIGIGGSYVRYIIARNWALVVATVLQASVSVIFQVSVFGAYIVSVISLAVLFLVLRFGYLVARHATGAAPWLALGLAIGDYVVSSLIGVAALQLFVA